MTDFTHDKIKELLKSVRHASMATVNEDGTPHNTPFLFMYDDRLQNIYWGSHPDSQHSKNIVRTGQLFVSLFNSIKGGIGLYLKAENGHIAEDKELEESLEVHNNIRKKLGKTPLEINYYTGKSPQRMWTANITKIWINSYEKDSNGRIMKDFREEISFNVLLDL